MRSVQAFYEQPQGDKIPRLSKRLHGEIYVASEANATPPQNYAPQSNFSAGPGVSSPWTPGTQVLSSP
ncbi:hypothetical protein SAMN05444158_5939 [Bradyrhizobium canariense]|uniref:Uncharacterized protein n=1 Tax=Bradyrhizobium canariense TaxID=255045 RepID=A0A1H2A7D2_9BRAD|nr:hypothetical protein SAMN05444158_5939 [Bradyrhizobium canariense]